MKPTFRTRVEKRRIARLIGWIKPGTHITMEARRRPVAYAPDQPMLERIHIDVIDMQAEVVFVADHVFPITMLPDTMLASQQAHRRPILVWR